MNKYRHKYNIILCLVLFMVAALTSCDLEGDVDATLSQKATLKINGKMVIAKASIPTDGYGSSSDDSNEKLTVNSVRILTFYNNSVVYNGLVEATGEWDSTSEAYIVSVSKNVDAYIGTNTVYVVLNEDASLADALAAIKTQREMEALRTEGLIPYNPENFRITDESADEPAFMMCTYDTFEVTSTTQVYDLTGLRDESFGFPMRRTMAKIVLDEIIGGVTPDGYIMNVSGPDGKVLKTEEYKYNSNDYWSKDYNETYWKGIDSSDEDPYHKSTNTALIATSQLHILDVELINVPKNIYWFNENHGVTSYDDVVAPFSIVSFDYADEDEEIKDRSWPGDIKVTGTVPFTRTDRLAAFWHKANGSGSGAYGILNVETDADIPDSYFWLEETYYNQEGDAEKGIGYSHYEMDNLGNITLYKKDGSEIKASDTKNSKYSLNSGNFTSFFADGYWNSNNYIEGVPIAGVMESTDVTVKPAVWIMNFNKSGYYVPENVVSDPYLQTKIRVTFSKATATASFTKAEIQAAVDQFMKDNPKYDGELVSDEGTLNMTDDNIAKFLFAKGEYVGPRVVGGANMYAMRYDGLKRIFKGTTDVIDKDGRYDNITGNTADIFYIDIPLTNDDYKNTKDDEDNWQYDTNEDNNIKRGTEYRVKLYVTNQGALNQAKSASRTINIGGEELTITGKVVATPME